jgi:hypothetical protein
LRSVIIDGGVCKNFNEDSVTVLHSPAQVICTTA